MSNEILELMLQAEKREITVADTVAQTIPPEAECDPFDRAETIVEFVGMQMEYDFEIRGEIDAVGQEHYLRGPNFDERMDDEYWENEPSVHNNHCHEFWDRGLNCPHISEHQRNAIVNGEVDPGWGQYD